MDRLVLSDAAWERMAPLIIGRPGPRRVRPGVTTGCSWKACCGSCVRALPGVTFRKRLGIGTACSGASVDGVKVSVATTLKHCKGGQFVTHVKALPGNPYDGHTLASV